MSEPAAESVLRAAGAADDRDIDVAGTALALAALDRPRVATARYRAHLQELCEEVREAAGGGAASANAAAAALRQVLAGRYGYRGDALTYDDMQNANLMRVMDRRRGLPVALGILYIHAGRSAGWAVDGIRFPGHFLIRLDLGGERRVVDPFDGGSACDAARMRHLAKQVLGEDAELEPAFLEPSGNREILLRLLNNIRTRAVKGGQLDRADEILRRMLLLAPDHAELHRDKAILQASRNNLRDAIGACERYLDLAADDRQRHDASRLLQQLRRRLN